MYGKRTILFVDEIHRFNKGQQDYLLPFVEDGTLILIGATTENPYFEVNSALISRSRIFELKPLETQDILELIQRAITDVERGMGTYDAVIEPDAARFLADAANGDAQRRLKYDEQQRREIVHDSLRDVSQIACRQRMFMCKFHVLCPPVGFQKYSIAHFSCKYDILINIIKNSGIIVASDKE